MNPPDRKEDEVRRMLDVPHPAVPPDLAARAAERGQRILGHRRAVRTVAWVLLLAAAVAFAVWAAVVQPWVLPPTGTTPPLEGW
jgi:ferric-dicitrate binding protein FerR (iron transport regulator)